MSGTDNPAIGILVAAYTNEEAAATALENVKQAKKDDKIEFEDAAVIRKDSDGKLHIEETGDLSVAKGAGIGAIVGAIIGALAGPAGAAMAAGEAAAIGAGTGAATGAIAGSPDEGISDDSLEKVGGAMPAGTSALTVVTSQALVEETQDMLPKSSAVVADDLATTIGQRLGAGQDTLLAVGLTPDGVIATDIVSSPDELAIFGMASTGDTVAVAGTVATEDGVAAGGAVAKDG